METITTIKDNIIEVIKYHKGCDIVKSKTQYADSDKFLSFDSKSGYYKNGDCLSHIKYDMLGNLVYWRSGNKRIHLRDKYNSKGLLIKRYKNPTIRYNKLGQEIYNAQDGLFCKCKYDKFGNIIFKKYNGMSIDHIEEYKSFKENPDTIAFENALKTKLPLIILEEGGGLYELYPCGSKKLIKIISKPNIIFTPEFKLT